MNLPRIDQKEVIECLFEFCVVKKQFRIVGLWIDGPYCFTKRAAIYQWLRCLAGLQPNDPNMKLS